MKTNRLGVWSLGLLFGGAGVLALALGLKTVADGTAVARQAMVNAKTAILNQLVAGVSELSQEWELIAIQAAQNWGDPADSDYARRLLRSSPDINYLASLDSQGRVLYPPAADLTPTENSILENLPRLSNARTAAGEGSHSSPAGPWLHLYEQATSSLFLAVETDGATVFVGITTARVWADIAFWAAREKLALESGWRLVMTAPGGSVFYQWGLDATTEEQPVVRSDLPPPLQGWQFQLKAERQALPESAPLLLWLTAFAMAVGWGFAVYQGIRFLLQQQRITEQRQSFVNQVSHELKTPLTNIRLYTDLLRRKLGKEAEGKTASYLHVLDQETSRLTRLIRNVLTFAGKEQSTVPERVPTELPEVLRRVAAAAAPSLEGAGMVLTIDNDMSEPVLTHADTLEQILGNLVGNAEKYAAGGKELLIRSRKTVSGWRIEVEDKGPGIPHDQKTRVFQPFVRLHNRTIDPGGSGLGLTIAAELTRQLGGKLTLESPVPDSQQGCRFTLVFEGSL